MYIIVKQLSKANPTKKRHKVNCQKLTVNAVATPARNPIRLAPIKAGILPYWSATHPKINPPKIAPIKKILWAMVGSASYWQTHPSCNRKLRSNNLLLITISITGIFSNFNVSIKWIFDQSFEISNEARLCPLFFSFEEKGRRSLRPYAFSRPSSPRGIILLLTSDAKFMEIQWSKKSCNLCRTNLHVRAVARYGVLLKFLFNPIFSISVLSHAVLSAFITRHFLSFFFSLSIFISIYSIISYLAM